MRPAVLALLFVLGCASGATKPDAAEGPDAEQADLAMPPPPDAPMAVPDTARDSVPSSREASSDDTPDAAAPAEVAPPVDAAPSADATAAAFELTSTGFLMKNGDLVFPASSSYPMDQSPPFAWTGAPPGTASFALTFVDESNGATKWVIWDIPADVTALPANLSKSVHPSELPSASQRGSLGRTGYSGPGVAGPPLHLYQFVLWALDVQKLPGTDGMDTVALRTKVLPMHALAKTAPLVAKGQLGGP